MVFVDERGQSVAVEKDPMSIVVHVYRHPMRSRFRVIVRISDDGSGSRPTTRYSIGGEDSFRLS